MPQYLYANFLKQHNRLNELNRQFQDFGDQSIKTAKLKVKNQKRSTLQFPETPWSHP